MSLLIHRTPAQAVAISLLPALAAAWWLSTGALGPVAAFVACVLPAIAVPLWLLQRARADRLVLQRRQAQLEATLAERNDELAAREAVNRVLADVSPQIIWQADETGCVTHLSRAWHRMVGKREGGWLGWRWFGALHPDDVQPTRDAFLAAAQAKETMRVRRRFRSHQGSYRSFLAVAAPVLRADGSIERWVGADTDITHLERHAGRLKQLDDELESLSYTVSHDLRAPVTVIKGFVDALLAGHVGVIDAAARSSLERVRRNAARMDELMTDLLHLWSLSSETLRCQPFDPVALARGVVDLIQDRYPDRVVECLASGCVEISADRRLFEVLLEHLMDNAAKFSPARPVCRIEVQARYERDEVVVEVADRGVGFPNELASRLFRPFQRLHPDARFPGSGVGLATVARIVRVHGGTIEGRNRSDGGAVFRIHMPQHQPLPTMPADLTTMPAALAKH